MAFFVIWNAVMLLLALTLTAAHPETKIICRGTTTPEANACQSARFNQADADLNKYYKAALAKLQKDKMPKVAQSLIQSQRAWIGYRDAECGAVFDNWSEGTIRVSMQFDCQTRLTQLRSYTIWKNWLTFMDSTSPILPRPAIEAAITNR